jgi:hypothetical protein
VQALNQTIQRPVVAATLAYGVSALLVRVAATAAGITQGTLSDARPLMSLMLFVVLPVNALLGASVVLVKDGLRDARSAIISTLAQVGYPAAALGAAALFLGLAFDWQPHSQKTTPPTTLAAPEPVAEAPTQRATAEETTADALASETGAPKPREENELAHSAGAPDAAEEPTHVMAPKEELAVARERGALALSELSEKYPKDPTILKALVLAHASRADTLDLSASAIVDLLSLDENAKEDPEVIFILKKALLSRGKAHTVASGAVLSHLGQYGGELLYDLMSENPKQRNRLKTTFLALRKNNQVSPETSVAYDLRYSSSCHGRLAFLPRAEEHGDLRSLRQLQALSTAPRRCGWGRTCYPPCRSEAQRFKESARIIEQRLNETNSD